MSQSLVSVERLHALVAGELNTLSRQERVAAQALAQLGDIQLPDAGPPLPSVELSSTAALYLCSQVDAAGLLVAADTIAGLFNSGAIRADIGTAGPLLRRYWRERQSRLAAGEREAIYAQVFDAGFGTSLESLAIAVASLAVPLEPGGLQRQQRVELALGPLLEQLASRVSGMVAYAAQEVLGQIDEVLRIVKEPALLAAYGVQQVWDLVRAVAPKRAQAVSRVQAHLDAGRGGQLLLAWATQANALHKLAGDAALRTRLITAAQRWQQAQQLLAQLPPRRDVALAQWLQDALQEDQVAETA